MKTTDKDILKDNARLKEMPFGTSEGYFQNLKKNLKSIPKEQSDKRISPTWSRISAAAAIVIIAAIRQSLSEIMPVFATTVGGFLILGLILGGIQSVKNAVSNKKPAKLKKEGAR